MSETIQDDKFVELSYQVIDKKSGEVLNAVEYPIGYVHGQDSALDQSVTIELEGKKKGDIIDVTLDCNTLYGPRDESLVFTDHIDNVPEEYREIGTTITMENEKGEPRNFIVTRMDDKTLTVDGNNPLCGRVVIFKLEVLNVRDASEEEMEAGGAIVAEPDIDGSLAVPIHKV
ncbi:MAG: peptidylprolyl isomerase [Rhodospirillaceae bacterium]|jgi:FKBP-type peptidyl-prolyl cis-trans isomerase SlyD|nr:peptidylprolyl isomerase [Rhodospirillaceae bacterium]MBT7357043.1 peptidylprolyl isomerase [Rhodospirillaceae bacterium]